jgi:2-polyprenyl-3-methyl-5-hydroxy-6-metoxy-1,4-benzoquinol methylase
MFQLVEHLCPICPTGTSYTVRFPAQFDRESLQFIARKTPDHMHFRIVRCDGCGLIFSNPIIPPEEIMALYRESGFIAEEQLLNMRRDYVDELQTILPLVERGRLLEVGCSNGFFLQEIRRLGFNEIHGVEPSREAVAHADPSVRANIVNDQLRPGLFAPEYFDVICFFQVFDHVVNPNDFLQNVRHYLKPNGTVFAIHHNIRSMLPTLLGVKASTYDISHIHLWDPETMGKILKKNGFRVLAIRKTANRYQLDHVLRMLPLPAGLRHTARRLCKTLRLSDVNLRAAVENMSCAAARAS